MVKNGSYDSPFFAFNGLYLRSKENFCLRSIRAFPPTFIQAFSLANFVGRGSSASYDGQVEGKSSLSVFPLKKWLARRSPLALRRACWEGQRLEAMGIEPMSALYRATSTPCSATENTISALSAAQHRRYVSLMFIQAMKLRTFPGSPI